MNTYRFIRLCRQLLLLCATVPSLVPSRASHPPILRCTEILFAIEFFVIIVSMRSFFAKFFVLFFAFANLRSRGIFSGIFSVRDSRRSGNATMAATYFAATSNTNSFDTGLRSTCFWNVLGSVHYKSLKMTALIEQQISGQGQRFRSLDLRQGRRIQYCTGAELSFLPNEDPDGCSQASSISHHQRVERPLAQLAGLPRATRRISISLPFFDPWFREKRVVRFLGYVGEAFCDS
ncbi:hypothetical protein H4582DRAFT_1044867 [Lactarius indigo]|nr:hypothetical protein H4582DRAFT_1044867 [Lactarius indigo]